MIKIRQPHRDPSVNINRRTKSGSERHRLTAQHDSSAVLRRHQFALPLTSQFNLSTLAEPISEMEVRLTPVCLRICLRSLDWHHRMSAPPARLDKCPTPLPCPNQSSDVPT